MDGAAAMMAPDQFDEAVAQTRIKPDLQAAARRVLVEGESGSEVAREIGMTQQQLSRAVQRIRQAAGLVTVSVTLADEHRAALVAWVTERGGVID